MTNIISNYINQFPEGRRSRLNEMRGIIEEILPEETTQKLGYGMPNYYLNGNLVYFAGFKNHIGFFPTPSGTNKFKDQLTRYKHSKGGIQFSYDEPLPKTLIQEIVKFKLEENLKSANKKP